MSIGTGCWISIFSEQLSSSWPLCRLVSRTCVAVILHSRLRMIRNVAVGIKLLLQANLVAVTASRGLPENSVVLWMSEYERHQDLYSE